MGGKTVTRLAILITAILLGGVSLFFIQRYQVTRMARSELAKAGEAEKKGDFSRAEELYEQHLQVVPEDLDSKAKYADAILKAAKTPARMEQALQLYNQVLTRAPGREDVRRHLAELAVEMGRFDTARLHLGILLKSSPDDGALQFLMGRSQEAGEQSNEAAAAYQAAIKNGAPQRLEAYQRLAAVLRTKLNRPADADRLIEEMVRSDAENYQVYVERGKYFRTFHKDLPGGLDTARADLEKARQKAPREPQVYLELAQLAQEASDAKGARGYLESGLREAPKEASLYSALAVIEQKAGRVKDAMGWLRRGLETADDTASLRTYLAFLLAEHGENSELLLQLEEMKKTGLSPVINNYLMAWYFVNSREWNKARQLLVPLQTELDAAPDLKARVNLLLARCYRHLGDVEREQEAYLRATRANPESPAARLAWIESMIAQGEIDRPIEEYRKLVGRIPQIRPVLTRLLIARNRQRPADQRDWKEVGDLIAQMPDSAEEKVILDAERLVAQNQFAEAQDLVERARGRFPRSGDLWIVSFNLMMLQGKYAEALAVLDQAQKLIGDTVPFRLAKARLWAARGGADLPDRLVALAENSASFSKEDRIRLLGMLAVNLTQLKDLPRATRLWSEVAALDPNSLNTREQLFNLALQGKDKAEIERNLGEIKRIEGTEGDFYRYGVIEYTAWKARNSADKNEKARLRTETRSLLNELSTRRPDWSLVPLARARLEEEELADAADLDPAAKKRKQGDAADYYLRAIELGYRDLGVTRRVTELLYATDRSAELSQLWSQLPALSNMATVWKREAADIAVRNQDYDRALEMARNAVQASPNDFKERLWLVQVLFNSGHRDEAEAELRRGVNQARAEPVRWIVLVKFLVQIGEFDKAEKVVQEAEAALSKEQAPLALAQCSETLAQNARASNRPEQAAQWYGKARTWYEQARTSQPDDPAVTREYVEFLLRAEQPAEAEKLLTEIVNRGPGSRKSDEFVWARRKLALTLVSQNDYQKTRRALALFEPGGPGEAGQAKEQPSRTPEDLSVLAKVYFAQNTIPYRKRAVEALQELAAGNLAGPDDRFLLARMYNAGGEWPKAQEQYRTLLAATNSPDAEVLVRRPVYIAGYVSDLLEHVRPDQTEDLNEADELIQQLKKTQPDSLAVLVFETRLFKARNQAAKAAGLIENYAGRQDLSEQAQRALAEQAEALDQLELAERLFRQYATRSKNPQARLLLATFLSRHGRTREALDICEKLRGELPNPEQIAAASIEVLFTPGSKPDETQISRVAGWLEQDLAKDPRSPIVQIGLGNLRERQGRYPEAEAIYRRVIEQGGGDVIPLNNLAWLMALKKSQGSTALELINRAIALRGPLPDFLDTRGIVYLASGEPRHAIEDLENAVAAAPSPAKYFHLAQAYLAANDKEAAKQNLDKARTQGLALSSLHPLEAAPYEQVVSALEPQGAARP